MVSRFSAGAIAAALFTGYSLASVPQLDIAAVAQAGAPPEPSIAINVPSQKVTYDAPAAQSSAAAEQSAVATSPVAATKVKRGACDPQWTGKGPVPSPDTDQAFLSYSAFSSAASAAPTPSGYINTFKNLQAENNALGYMGYTLLDSYDVLGCSQKCDAINGCSAFNVAFERSPSLDPSPSGGACEQPNSSTLIKCVFWGGPVTAANAVNNGQYRNNYHVVVAGSNGYVNQTVDYCAGYGDAHYLGGNAISAPNDCNGRSTYLGNQYWNDGKPFDTRRCSAACTAQTAANPSSPCRYFNTYVISKDGKSFGQYCAMYSQEWADSYATVNQVAYNGSTYSINYSYAFSNATNNGLPCTQTPTTGCLAKQQGGACGSIKLCNVGQACWCQNDVDGNNVCAQAIACGTTKTCSANSDCANGWVCLKKNNCCGASVCAPNTVCANGMNARSIFKKRGDDDVLTTVHVPGSDDNNQVGSGSSDGPASQSSDAPSTQATDTSTAQSSDASSAQATDGSSS